METPRVCFFSPQGLPEIVKDIFDVLDLLVFRLTLLGLAVIGAYTLIRGHLH